MPIEGEVFRAEAREWLEENCPASMRTPVPENGIRSQPRVCQIMPVSLAFVGSIRLILPRRFRRLLQIEQ